MTALFAAAIAIIALALMSWVRLWSKDRVLAIPGPMPLPVVGNLPALGALPHRSLRDIGMKYAAGLFRMHLGPGSCAIILTGEQAIREMHGKGRVFYARPNYEIATIFNLEGHGFSFTAGEQWTKVRRLATDLLLSRARSREMVPQIETEADHLVTALTTIARTGGTCELKHELQAATANLYTKMAWNQRLADSVDGRDSQLVRDLDLIFFNVGRPNPRDYFAFLKWLPSPRVSAVRAARARVRATMEDIIAEHRAKLDPEHPRDMIDVLLKAATDSVLSELDLQQMVAEMFIGAVVPGAMPITWAILVLINRPEIQRRLHAELASAARSGAVGMEVLERLPYFQAFVSELLRLYGASPLIPRRNVEATEIAGYRIPADSEILVNYYGLHTDPAVWADPFAFRPERFLEEDASAAENWKRNYMPFGKGGRNCPGKPLAEYELQIFLSRLVVNFEFSAPDPAGRVPMDETIGLALCPVHSRVLLAVRSNSHPLSSTTAVESPHAAADSPAG